SHLITLIVIRKERQGHAKNRDTLLKGLGPSGFSAARCRLHHWIGNLSLSHHNGQHGRHIFASFMGDRRRLYDSDRILLRRECVKNSKGWGTLFVCTPGTGKYNRFSSRLVVLDWILAHDIDRDKSALALFSIPPSQLLQ